MVTIVKIISIKIMFTMLFFRLKTFHNSTRIESESHSVVFYSLQPHGLYSPWNSPGHNTGVGSHSLLQGFLRTQGSNPAITHGNRIFTQLHQLRHQGSPRTLQWVAYPFSSRSTRPRNPTGVSCIISRFKN